nr:MAG TPA: hypothetical protein [Caudoviricetes sp.]
MISQPNYTDKLYYGNEENSVFVYEEFVSFYYIIQEPIYPIYRTDQSY